VDTLEIQVRCGGTFEKTLRYTVPADADPDAFAANAMAMIKSEMYEHGFEEEGD
jgi:hypothetical protein